MTTRLHRDSAGSWRRTTFAFVVAALCATAWGSVVQTQFNLQALVALDVEVPLRVRALTTLQDLVGFGPAYAGIVLAAWLPAFGAAALGTRLAKRCTSTWRTAIYALAGGVGLVVAVRVVDAVAPMPVLIDATRGMGGLLAMAAGSVAAGALFARLAWGRAIR